MNRNGSVAAAGDRCPRCEHEVGDSWLICAWCGEQLAVAAELRQGSRIGGGRYQILDVLGRGGFGITYEAGDRRLERRVAIKELFPDSAVRHGSVVLTPPKGRSAFKEARERFMREARVLARFTQPGIVRVYEVFEENGTAYLVMELLEGRNLIELLQERGKPFPEAQILDVAGRVAAALRPVHAAAVLHRDINPSNVMMTDHGRIVVIDFGLARQYDQSTTVGMTRVVTPGYAPLEQYQGIGRFGPPTDVYGLAASLYRLATGKVPTSAIEREAGMALRSVHSLNPDISKPVSDAIGDGLELRPDHRPRDLDSFLARLGVPDLPTGTRSTLADVVDRRTPLAPPAQVFVPASGPAAAPVDPAAPRREAPGGGERVAEDPQTEGPPARVDDGDRRVPAAVRVAEAMPDRHDAATDIYAEGADDRDATLHVAPRALAPRAVAPRAVAPRAVAEPPPMDPDATLHPGPVRADGSGGDLTSPRPAGPPADLGRLDRRRSLAAASHHRDASGEVPGRLGVTLPLAVAAVAAGSAAPVAVAAFIVVVALPLLATIGISSAHRARSEAGLAASWSEARMPAGVLAGPRFIRSVAVSAVRSVPAIGLGAMLMAAWYAIDRLGPSTLLSDGLLRGVGAVVAAALVATGAVGSARFRTTDGIDAVTRALRPGGRVSERVIILWLVSAAITAAALWLAPTPFPLPPPG